MMVAPDVWLSFLTKKPPEDQKDKTNLTIYGCLVAASLVFAIIRAYGFILVSLRSSERLHDKMVVAILQAPVLFFDSNPVGRILNRFSKDIGCLDELLPKTFLASIQYVLLVSASIIVPTITNPWLLLIVVPLAVVVMYISRYYLKTSRQLKRLESICRSPVFSHISETLNGLDTIRTRGRQKDFVDKFCRYVGDFFIKQMKWCYEWDIELPRCAYRGKGVPLFVTYSQLSPCRHPLRTLGITGKIQIPIYKGLTGNGSRYHGLSLFRT